MIVNGCWQYLSLLKIDCLHAWFVWSCFGDYLQNTVFSKANIRRWWIFCRSNFKMLLVHFDCHAVLSEPKHAYSDTNSKIFLHHFQDHVTVCGTDPLSLQPLKQKFCRHQWKQLHLFGWKIFLSHFKLGLPYMASWAESVRTECIPVGCCGKTIVAAVLPMS